MRPPETGVLDFLLAKPNNLLLLPEFGGVECLGEFTEDVGEFVPLGHPRLPDESFFAFVLKRKNQI